MRKNIFIALFAAVLLCLSQTVSAVPAKPGRTIITQPDGKTVAVYIHGDEWFHYMTDESGNIVEHDPSGFVVKSSETMADITARMAKVQAQKTQVLQMRQDAIAKAKISGTQKIPVILVQFTDKSFVINDPKTSFQNLLSKPGYSENGCNGSVLDYYQDQSRGAYSPDFVVMDVVTLSGSMSTYGSNDNNAAKALYEACQKLDATVDFSQFDNDGDGKIDMALMYFAGYNEAEGGPSSTIWPHQYYVPYVVTNAQAFDGVKLDRYFCTSELKGASGSKMCGIGTTCHEFAHSLGLPDFYDTTYNNYGDGEAGATYNYDVMCSGSYNNNGCTPPWMNAEELVMLGWMDGITEISSVGSVTLPSISIDRPVAYKLSTQTSGEYFLLECRPGTEWDAPLTPGLLIYHVDKATSHTIRWNDGSSRSATAYNLWANWASYNAINASGTHPCFYIVPSGNQTSLNYSGTALTYPGSRNVVTYAPVDWDGNNTGLSLSNIKYDSSSHVVTFNLDNANQCGVTGYVFDSEGNPLEGAKVTVSTPASSAPASSNDGILRPVGILKAASAVGTAVTDAYGAYSITLENPGTYVVSASLDGYVGKSLSVEVSRTVTQNFYLLREGEEAPSELITYPEDGDWYSFSFGQNPLSIMCANYYSSSMLSPYSGKQIKSISFMIGGETDSSGNTATTGTVYSLLDFGTERKAFIEVKNPSVTDWNTVDLTGEEIIIPDGKDIYAGYALNRWAAEYCIIATEAADDSRIGYYSAYTTGTPSWSPISDGTDLFVFAVKLTIGDYTPPETGYNFIDNPGNGVYNVGDMFELTLLETTSDRKPDMGDVEWYFDDEPVWEAIKLPAGDHTVSARFMTESGDYKVIDLEITVR